MASSFSSLTKRHVEYEDLTIFINNSLERTSSFFWSSPVLLDEPASP